MKAQLDAQGYRLQIAFQANRKPGQHFCESCRSLKIIRDKRAKVTKGWKCPDCRLVNK